MLAPYAPLKNIKKKKSTFPKHPKPKKSKSKAILQKKRANSPPFEYIGNVASRSKGCLIYFNRLLEFRLLLPESPVIFEVAISEPIYL